MNNIWTQNQREYTGMLQEHACYISKDQQRRVKIVKEEKRSDQLLSKHISCQVPSQVVLCVHLTISLQKTLRHSFPKLTFCSKQGSIDFSF